jgi:hypothetical protein
VRYRTFEFRHAEAVLNANLRLRREIDRVLGELSLPSNGHTNPSDTTSAHRQIQAAFLKRGWQAEVLVSARTRRRHFFDLYKERVAVEIEISSRDRLFRDYLRFLLAELDGRIDLGILILFDETLRSHHPAGLRQHVPRLEDVVDDLRSLRSIVGVPIWAVAIC